MDRFIGLFNGEVKRFLVVLLFTSFGLVSKFPRLCGFLFLRGLDASFDASELESSASSSLLEEDSESTGSETGASAGFKATSLAGTAGLLANSGKAWLLRGRPIGFLASLVAPEAVGLGGAGFLSVLLKVRGPLRSLVLVLGFATIFATLGQSVDT